MFTNARKQTRLRISQICLDLLQQNPDRFLARFIAMLAYVRYATVVGNLYAEQIKKKLFIREERRGKLFKGVLFH